VCRDRLTHGADKKANRTGLLLVGIFIAIAAVRLIMAVNIPIFSIFGEVDDWLLTEYAMLDRHFLEPSYLSLVKTMSYPVFLAFCHATGLPYRLVLGLFWLLAAFLMVLVGRHFTKNPIFALLVFVLVAFHPAGFDQLLGLRVYRNAVFAPSTIVMTALLLLLFLAVLHKRRGKSIVLLAVSAGVAFAFNYYLNENSSWTLAFLAAATVACLAVLVLRLRATRHQADGSAEHTDDCMDKGAGGREDGRASRAFVPLFVAVLLPALVFLGISGAYRAVNYHFFGVFEVETRLSGELGRFTEHVLRVDDANKTQVAWVPRTTIDMVWAASPTLQAQAGLYEALDKAYVRPDFTDDSTPFIGDHFFWSFHRAMYEKGIFDTEPEMQQFVAQVNAELEAAYRSGSLPASDKLFLSSKASGRSTEEIVALFPRCLTGLEINLLYLGYEVPGWEVGTYETNPVAINQANTTNYILNEAIEKPGAYNVNEFVFWLQVGSKTIKLYRVAAPLLVFASAVGLVYALYLSIRRRNPLDISALVVLFFLIGSGMVVIFGISWWSEFVSAFPTERVLAFYSVQAAALFTMAEVFGLLYAGKAVKSAWGCLHGTRLPLGHLANQEKG
jgi:hypothetical protein